MINRPLNEYTKVEKTLLDQLQGIGWACLEGDLGVPYITERESFREVLLKDRLREALRRINVSEDGEP